MMRLLGALVGSALAVAALIFLVGIPRIQTEPRYAPIGDNGVIRLPERPTSDPVAQAVSGELPASVPDTAPAESQFDAAEIPGETSEITEDTVAPPVMAEAPLTKVDVAEELRQWYAFWSPFRSEVAANGFVSQLQRVTGLDYRVVKVKTGVYEVAFAYTDEDEIMSSLAQISAATGLKLTEN